MFWNQTLVFTLVSWRYCLWLGRLLWPLWGPADCNNCLHKIFGRGGHWCDCHAASVDFGPITSGHKGRQRYEKAWRALTKSQRKGLEQTYKPMESQKKQKTTIDWIYVGLVKILLNFTSPTWRYIGFIEKNFGYITNQFRTFSRRQDIIELQDNCIILEFFFSFCQVAIHWSPAK